MIGKILTISDTDGQTYVNDAREEWKRQGYEIDAMGIEEVVSHTDFTNYCLLSFTMSKSNQDMFMSAIRIVKFHTLVPIAVFVLEPLTAETEINFLNAGIDRVLSLPMNMKPAIANCQAIIRRYLGTENIFMESERVTAPSFIECNGLMVDLDHWAVFVQGQEVILTPREHQLLRFFAEHKYQVLTPRQIFNHVWGDDIGYSSRIVSNLVSRLRAKLMVSPNTPEYIINIRGVGYRFCS